MTSEGPLLEDLMRRLSECPEIFLAPPLVAPQGVVDVDAVAADLFFDLGIDYASGGLIPQFNFNAAKFSPVEVNRQQLVLICFWLLHDPWFLNQHHIVPYVVLLAQSRLNDLASLVSAKLFVTDRDRREELVRVVLAALDMRPKGETQAQATDRLSSLDTVERQRVVLEAKKAHERAAAVLKAMTEKAAQEAAAKVSRE